jgi:hypothetical protein
MNSLTLFHSDAIIKRKVAKRRNRRTCGRNSIHNIWKKNIIVKPIDLSLHSESKKNNKEIILCYFNVLRYVVQCYNIMMIVYPSSV